MPADNAIAALTLLFIAGLVWLRTRMHYQRAHTRLAVSRAGWIYFAGLALLLAAGWVAAPAALRALWPGPLATPLLARVVSFLATYFLFILVHQALRAQGRAVFRPRSEPLADEG